jgi:hypothetical protein
MCATIAKSFRRITTPHQKLDLKQQFEHLYAASPDSSRLLEVPPLLYLMVDGVGDPNTSVGFQLAIESLYAVAYRMKHTLGRADRPVDYPVMPLEGLWWADDPSSFSSGRRDGWKWTLMSMVPDLVSLELFGQTIAELQKRRPRALLDQVRLERLCEGTCAQTLHLGPYANVPATIARLHAYVKERQCDLRGRHHEIYLDDPKRIPAERLRTIIRQPVE